MSRPVKARTVCSLPEIIGLSPIKKDHNTKPGYRKKLANLPDTIVMSVVEYEVIRLIDYEDKDQKEAANSMNVARTTVQAIYSRARKKIAQAILEGKNLVIAGGNYRLCNGETQGCTYGRCRHGAQMMTDEAKIITALKETAEDAKNAQKEDSMKLVVPVTENTKEAKVSNVFGRAAYYLIYNTDTDEYEFIDNTAAKSSGGAGTKAAQIIVDTGVRVLLTPRCGTKAGRILNAAEFEIFQTEGENLEENLKKFKNGDLKHLEALSPGKHHA